MDGPIGDGRPRIYILGVLLCAVVDLVTNHMVYALLWAIMAYSFSRVAGVENAGEIGSTTVSALASVLSLLAVARNFPRHH